jgi:hypothetical protein
MNKFLGVAAAVAISVSLSACASGPKNFSTVDELKTAYIQAGGPCASGTTIDTSAIAAASKDLTGIAGYSCTNDIGLFVFPNKKARDYFVDLIEGAASASKTGIHLVLGDKWLVVGVTLDNKKFASALGGTAR